MTLLTKKYTDHTYFLAMGYYKLHTNIKFVFKLRITTSSLFLYPLSILFLFVHFKTSNSVYRYKFYRVDFNLWGYLILCLSLNPKLTVIIHIMIEYRQACRPLFLKVLSALLLLMLNNFPRGLACNKRLLNTYLRNGEWIKYLWAHVDQKLSMEATKIPSSLILH